MSKQKMTSKTLAEMKDLYIGSKGNPNRDRFEYELRMDILGRMIRIAREERHLTQSQLGELVGVQRSQISKLESSANSATIDTVVKVFQAMDAEIYFKVQIDQKSLQL